ncbi:Glycosyltransferase [Sphingomonas paucimobilis]|nr:Glycosyltransferase [Sphingomonas paucimobilis]
MTACNGRQDTPVVKLAVIGLRGVSGVIGGIETHCRALYPAIVEQAPDFEVTMLVRGRYSRTGPSMMGNVALRSLPAPSGQGIEAFLHSLISLVYARTRLRAEIVHLHGIGPGILAPLARLMGMSVVVTHHAADFFRPKWGRFSRWVLRAGEELVARFADRIICVSGALQTEFLDRHPCARGRTSTIRHGVASLPKAAVSDILVRHGLSRGRYLLAVGRLERTKRYEDLIVAHSQSACGVLPLVIVGAEVGGTSYEVRLRRMAGRQVHFVGAQSGPALASLYEGAARFFHASQMEGFGLVVLEALSAGVPVTITDIAVHREFNLPGESYFRVGDIDALAKVMSRTGERKHPWPAAQPVVAQHSASTVVEAYIGLFRSLRAVRKAAVSASSKASNTAQ